jgi:hypothetical protein
MNAPGSKQPLQQPITTKITNAVTSMQYAHDTTLIINDEVGSLITMELILRILGRILGLALTLKKAFSFLSTSMMKPPSW